MTFNEAMTSKRLELGYTAAEVAKLTNISLGQISRYERAECEPGNEDFQAICSVLGLNIKEYIDGVMKARVDRYNFIQTRKHERMQKRLGLKSMPKANPSPNEQSSTNKSAFKPNHSICRFCQKPFPFNTGYELVLFKGKTKIRSEHACQKCYKEEIDKQVIVVK